MFVAGQTPVAPGNSLPALPPEKMTRERSTLDFIRTIVRRYPGRTLLLVLLLVLSGAAESVGIVALLPLLELTIGTGADERSALSRSVEGLLSGAGIPIRLEAMLVLISAAMVLKGGFRLLAMRQVGYTVSRVGTDLRFEYIDSLLKTRWSHFIQQPAGRFATAIGAEAMRASAGYKQVCALFAVLVQVVIYTAFALLISWQIALLALAAGMVLMLVRSPLVRRARGASRAQNRLVKSISIRLTDALAGIKPIKAMGGEQYLRPLLRGEVSQLNLAQERQVLATEAVSATREPVLVVLLSIVLYVILSTTPMSFAAVLVVAFLFVRLAGQISQAQVHYQEIALGEAAFWSIRESIEEADSQREPTAGTLPPPPLHDGLILDDVTFSYGGHLVLDRVRLEVPAGEFVALIGPSGAGKTSIADLIAGLYSPERGRILVDGVPLEDINLAAWRERIGYVPQDAFLFHDTLYHNISMGNPEITRAEVDAALEVVGARNFIVQLPQGLNTVLGERGARLSGGQRQRVAIARALVRRPRLLILDEVTTALDPVTEVAICQTLRQLRGSVTVLAISHQPALMEVADRVYRLDQRQVRRSEPVAEVLT
jgi:ATP-binding cassette, subfamily C, bacterial